MLSPKQLQRLTGRKRPQAQIRVLRSAGIEFLIVDGKPIVTKDALRPERPKGRLVLT